VVTETLAPMFLGLTGGHEGRWASQYSNIGYVACIHHVQSDSVPSPTFVFQNASYSKEKRSEPYTDGLERPISKQKE